MDTSTRTLTASLAVVTLAALVVHTLSHPSTTSPPLDSNGRRIKGNRRANQRTRKNEEDQDTPQYIVGLVNVGNTCFVNSVLQALASLPSLRSYLEARKELGHEQDSITLTLGETVEMLNAVQGRRGTRRLDRILKSLKAKASHVLTSQQQDAQELFQIISTHLSEEREKLDHIGAPSLFDIRMTLDDIPGSISPPPVPMSSSSLISTSTSFSSRMRRSSVSSIMSTSQLLLPPSTSSRRHSANAVSGNHTKLSDSIQNINDGMKEASSNDSDDNNNGSTTANSMAESAMLDCREQEKYSRAKSPFMGLLASRVSCVDCGYTAAIRHSTFDNLSLTVPMQYACTLEDCLDAFIHLDTIHDFNCRKCTLIGASKDLERKISQGKQRQEERERRSRQSINLDKSDLPNGDHWDESAIPLLPSNSSTIEPVEENDDADKANKKSKGTIISLEEMLQLKDRIDDCLANNIEKDLSPIELKAVQSKRTTKHSMIAKPPRALCLHLNRSMFTPSGQIGKNPCRVQFGTRLDFTRFTTSGHLTTVPTSSMSRRGSLANGRTASSASRPILSSGARSWTGSSSLPGSTGLRAGLRMPVVAIPVQEETTSVKEPGEQEAGDRDPRILYRLCAVVVHHGVHNSGHFITYRVIPSSSSNAKSSKWWRVSDEDVQIVDWDLVKNVEAYMLFYEKEA